MGRNKRTRISQARPGKELEDCVRCYNWIHQGTMEKYASGFIPLSDDCEDSVFHNARRIVEQS